MKQLTEDYVAYETAVLLKEKGFRAVTNRYYNAQYDQIRTVSDSFMMDWNDEEYMKSITMPGAIAIPTHQMALKWMREVHNIHIEIYRTACGYLYIISNIPYGTDLYNPEYGGDDENSGQWTTYEKAVEAALLYVLKNLI